MDWHVESAKHCSKSEVLKHSCVLASPGEDLKIPMTRQHSRPRTSGSLEGGTEALVFFKTSQGISTDLQVWGRGPRMTPFPPSLENWLCILYDVIVSEHLLHPGIPTVPETSSVRMEHVHDWHAFLPQRIITHPSKPKLKHLSSVMHSGISWSREGCFSSKLSLPSAFFHHHSWSPED